MIIQKSPIESRIKEVMATQSHTQFTIDCMVYSLSDSTFKFKPIALDGFTILQDFASDYTDKVRITFAISPKSYADIYDRAQDLRVTLRITYLDPKYGTRLLSPAPIVNDYVAFIVKAENIRKRIRNVASLVTPNMTMVLDLIDTDVYHVRHKHFHGTFKDVTVEKVLRYIAKSFDVKTLHLTPPDNTHVFDHIIIPPSKDFSEIFDFIQHRYGVYNKGMESYYTDGVLYIYPPYENEPNTPSAAHIYQAEPGAYAGALSFHRYRGKDIDIVTPSGVNQSIDYSYLAAENTGTTFMVPRSSERVDGFVQDGDNPETDLNATMMVSSKRSRTIASQSTNSKYRKPTDNYFKLTSELAKSDAVLTTIDWAQAIPYSLMPGQSIQYIHEIDHTMQVTPGILEAVGYDIIRGNQVGKSIIYNCLSRLRLRLKPSE